MRSRKPPKPKTPSITEQIRAKDEEQRLRDKAYEIWEKRGKAGTEEENWNAAIEALQRQQLLQPFSNFWHWTGIQEKRGWDVVQLLVGISIPIVLFVGGQYFTSQNNEKQQNLADDKAKQDTLVKYLDQMADSLKDDLLTAKPGDKKFIVAQSRTVLALQSLDLTRQHLVIQFLQAAGLNNVGKHTRLDKNGNIQFKKGEKVLLYQAQMSKANLANSDLSGGVLISANLERANLGCNPQESKDPAQCSDWSYTDLSGATLVSANLSGVHLNGADLSGATLVSANLSGAHLNGADLSGATLVSANLSGAHLNGADLSGTDLSRPNLNDADLNGTNLNDAVFLATDLRNAKNLDLTQLRREKPPLLCNVALPENFPNKDKLKDRDCDRLPQELLRRVPQFLKNIRAAKQYVDGQRRKQWE